MGVELDFSHYETLRTGCWGECYDLREEGAETCITRSVIICTSHQDDQIKEDDMGGTCSTLGDTGNAYKILVVRP
jgi:hypothetical protein